MFFLLPLSGWPFWAEWSMQLLFVDNQLPAAHTNRLTYKLVSPLHRGGGHSSCNTIDCSTVSMEHDPETDREPGRKLPALQRFGFAEDEAGVLPNFHSPQPLRTYSQIPTKGTKLRPLHRSLSELQLLFFLLVADTYYLNVPRRKVERFRMRFWTAEPETLPEIGLGKICRADAVLWPKY